MLKPRSFSKLLWLSVLLWVACGKQGPPLAPRIQIPEAVKDLAAAQVGHSVELRWTLPAFATDGERLTRPLEIEIFRIFLRKGKIPPEQFEEGNPWVTLASGDIRAPAAGWEGAMNWVDSFEPSELASAPEGRYRYAVRTSIRSFGGRLRRSELSNPVSLRVFAVSGPVTQLGAESRENSVRLEWGWESGTEEAARTFRGFQVYRSEGGEGDFRPYGEASEPHFEDPEFRFDREIRYKVRVKFGDGEYASESEDSSVVSITPTDVFPPRSPTGLDGLYSSEAIELIWEPNSEVDLAGYHVYRREGSEPYRRLTLELLQTPIFRDTTIEVEHRYTYRVTAVDLKRNESSDSDAFMVEAQ